MRGGLVAGAGCALHGVRIVCDAMRSAQAGWDAVLQGKHQSKAWQRLAVPCF